MSIEKKINHSVVRLEKSDITDTEIEAIVYYATADLKLGAGFGNAISMRGGPSIKVELDEIGGAQEGDAVITKAGEMKAKHIIHAVGPKFQEVDTERKLKNTIINALKLADERNIKQIAFPTMGAGFYVIALPVCADVMLNTIKEYLEGDTGLSEVVICALDNREFIPFQEKMESLN